MFAIEVTFTLAQANNDIVDDLPKLTVARGKRRAIVLLLSSSARCPWESAAATTVSSVDIVLEDLLPEVPTPIFSPSTSAGLRRVQYIRAGKTVANARRTPFQPPRRCRLPVL